MSGFNVEFELGKLQRNRKKLLLPGLVPEEISPFQVVSGITVDLVRAVLVLGT